MVFRCEYYICYRKLSVVLAVPSPPLALSPQRDLSDLSRSLLFLASFTPRALPFRQTLRSLTGLLLRYILRFVLTDDYDTDKGKDSPTSKKKNPPSDSQNQKHRAALLMNYLGLKTLSRRPHTSPPLSRTFIRQTSVPFASVYQIRIYHARDTIAERYLFHSYLHANCFCAQACNVE